MIYQGHTGDEGAYFADLILPSSAYTEKTGTYVNTDGRVQIARAATSPPGLARADWEILRALSEELGTPLPYDTKEELRTRIGELAPHLVRFDHIEPTGFEDIALQPKSDLVGKVNVSTLSDTVDNFYQTDVISRNS